MEPLDEAGIASTPQLCFHQLNDLDCVSYFVEGAEYGILDNYNPEQGIANGTTGIGVSLSLSILVCNYLLHQAHKELLKRIESEMTEHTSVEVLLISDIILFYMMHLNPQIHTIHTHCNCL